MSAHAKRTPATPGIGVGRTFVLAMRELRSGLGGFYILIGCIALGVMVIAAVGALSDALRGGFARQGLSILGGDMTFSRMHVRAEGSDRAWIEAQGRVSETATMRSIARRLDGEDQALVELKAVDGAYPLAGSVRLAGDASLDAIRDEPASAAVDPVLLERLGLKIGDRFRLGEKEITVRATVLGEPDGLIDRLTYGPRVLVSLPTFLDTGLLQPGSLVRWRYAVKLADGAGEDATALARVRDAAKAAMPESGFTLLDRRDPSPQVTKTLERLRQFLTLLGLTSLVVGGVGVANAVATFIDRRRKVIATMRSLGATGRMVFSVFLVQVLALAALGVAIGLMLGTVVPLIVTRFFGDQLPIRAELGLSWQGLSTAAAYGLLVALLFTLWPLGRAELVSASVLFRDEVGEDYGRPRRAIVLVTALVAAILVGAAVISSESRSVAIYFCAAVGLVFAVFTGLSVLVTRLALRVPRPRRPELALALANIGAPGGLTRSVILSLGCGLSLLAAVALADNSLVEELTSSMPSKSPNYFVLDIAKADFPDVAALIVKEVPGAKLDEAPMLRGRLVRLKDKNAEEVKAPPEAQWVLQGDRGLTYAEAVPEGSKVVAGAWWPSDYAGEPLVSFEADLANKLGLAIGDTVTVNVLGRNLTAKIANLREVKWESLALNFVMVFSPNTLAAAPHAVLATVTFPKGTSVADEARMARVLGKAFPAVTPIRVKDAIDAFNTVYSKIMVAVRVAGSVTLLAGALVLAGALATAQRRRILEAVILKVLGATRLRILTAHFTEYAILAAVTAVVSVGLGTLAAWVAVDRVMEIPFAFSWRAVVLAFTLAVGMLLAFGGMGTLTVLRARPVSVLKSE